MRLCDKEINIWLKKKKLIITPMPSKSSITGITVDVRLGNKFRTFNNEKKSFIDLSADKENIALEIKKNMSREIFVNNDNVFFISPKELILATTLEKFSIPDNLVGWLDGRSSLARLGLMIHATSHRVDPGWKGNIVLECFNSGNIKLALRPGMFIAALSFETLSQSVSHPYSSRNEAKYRNQKSVIISRINQD
ncbi:dCTP deaminase [Buchnera aphidicola (Mindarus keteleerifoliae)]|uniref:dCTP deaminase n=1 Tax=Buchnera aphidicola TaxID=9 RepID=UPI0031B6D805